MRVAVALALLLGVASTPSGAWGATEGPGVGQRIPAVRREGPIHIDGKLDEPAWDAAQPFGDFVQIFPVDGGRPSERTELRVLYDDETLYVGFLCFDSEPELVVDDLGRRDRMPASDNIGFAVDASHGHRSAYVFVINAGGVMLDFLLYDDTKSTNEWDAVWEGAAARRPDGWSAELAVPLSTFSFPAVQEQTWGFNARRYITRKNEIVDTVHIPREANAMVSRHGHLGGLVDLVPRRRIELAPYLAARTTLRPQYSDEGRPHPRLAEPSADLGMDFRMGLASDLTLNGAVNPDFGQVEADALILNLSNVETYFPEKRPLFLQGMEIFQPVGADVNQGAPQQLFYSRRIGLTTPILAAAKVTGNLGERFQLGILDAFVAGASDPNAREDRPRRELGYHREQPFRLAPESTLPVTPAAPQNFLAAVLRGRLAPSATLGATVTSAAPFTSTCTATDMVVEEERRPARCAVGGNAAALDWDLRTGDGAWAVVGQLDGSEQVGGPPQRVLDDGTVLRPGTTGMGGYLTAGKLGGEPLRFDLKYAYQSPTLDLNAVGFQPVQNAQHLALAFSFVRPAGWGPLHNFTAKVTADRSWSTDGRTVDLGRGADLTLEAQLPGYHFVSCGAGIDDPMFDLREIEGTGIPFQRSYAIFTGCHGNTNLSRPFWLKADVGSGYRPSQGGLPARRGLGAGLTASVRPNTRLETEVILDYDNTPSQARWVEATATGHRFAFQDAYSASITLRQQVVLTPRLTLQVYGQLFGSYTRYGPYYETEARGRNPIHFRNLRPGSPPSVTPNAHDAALNLNAVLRWEYRPGSTLFAVYSRSQAERPSSRLGRLMPDRLDRGPATDVFLVKWSYWWLA
jgi:hypothetical protein